jgi:hypothetical protein
MALANFVEYEQVCCPFLGFAVEIEPPGGPIAGKRFADAGPITQIIQLDKKDCALYYSSNLLNA